MPWWDNIFNRFNRFTGSRVINPLNNDLVGDELYDRLEAMNRNTNLYEELQFWSYEGGTWMEHMKPLRNPTNRSVSFFQSKVAIDPRVTSQNDPLKLAIEQVLNWSNFESRSSFWIMQDALFGNLLLRVYNNDTHVWLESIEIRYMTDFKEDERGNLVMLRVDIPYPEGVNHTEYWTTTKYAIYESDQNNKSTKLEDLKGRIAGGSLQETFGIDFVPFSLIRFQETPRNQLGSSCIAHAMDKITESDRIATRLHEIGYAFGEPVWILQANDKDDNGRPLPPPKIENAKTGDKSNNILSKLTRLVSLPGKATLASNIPNIPYDGLLAILNANEKQLELDLPELKYFSMDNGQLSGTAVRLLLSGAIDRCMKCRNAFKEGLEKSIKHALSIGVNKNIFGNIGSYDAGDFDGFTIVFGHPFPVTEEERSLIVKQYTDGGMPLPMAMRKAGFTEAEIEQAKMEQQEADQRKADLQGQSLAKAMQYTPPNQTGG